MPATTAAPPRPGLLPYGAALGAVAVRRRVEHTTSGYFPSLSTRTMVYKGMLIAGVQRAFGLLALLHGFSLLASSHPG